MNNLNIIVLGGGESGTGAAVLASKLGYKVFLSDKGVISDKYLAILDSHNIEYEIGNHDLKRIYAADLVIKSPGIPENLPLIMNLRERKIKIISEIEFAALHSRDKMICITGSNGKTTTTLLINHILQNAAYDSSLAGNVGNSLALQVAESPHAYYVVELSSFQLDGMYDFKADIAVITNITPDHLDRYDYKFENYVNSKFRIIQNMKAADLFIYGSDCKVVKDMVSELKPDIDTANFTYSYDKSNSAYIDNDKLIVNYKDQNFSIDKRDISIVGRHNVYNSMCAILACLKIGVPHNKIVEGLRTFPQVEHRLETVCKKDGVVYINDSKATNVDSTWYALDSMDTPVIWIAGGTDKGNDYSAIYDLVKKKVKVLICMGLDNKKLIESFSDICKVEDTNKLEDAVRLAKSYAKSGDTVLLSPCCASFDLFKNYENRGELFKKEVINS